MQRPLKDRRPVGPFVQTSGVSGNVAFFIIYEMDTSELSGLFEDVEENINDKLQTTHGGMVDGVSILRDSANSVEVMVLLDSNGFSDTQEDEIKESVGQELERVSQSSVEFDTYRYEW